MEQDNLVPRYCSAKRALENFSLAIPNSEKMPYLPYSEIKRINETAHKMGHVMIKAFFEPTEIMYIKSVIDNNNIIDTSIHEHDDIYELLNRYDRLTAALDMVADSMMFKFQCAEIKNVVNEVGKNLIASFFHENEMKKINYIKQQDTITTPHYKEITLIKNQQKDYC